MGDLDHSPRHQPEPVSLLNPEMILPEPAFLGAYKEKKDWIDEVWKCGGEKPSQYRHDDLQAWLDWSGNPEELEREEDAIDKIDHEVLYLDDYPDEVPDDIPDLEEAESVNTSVYDQLGATLASAMISTYTEAAGDMLNLSMGLPELPASHKPSDLVDKTDALSNDDQIADMFKVPTEIPLH